MSIWTILWALWGLAFFCIEIPAWRNKEDGDTLSEHVWWWIGLNAQKTRIIRWRRIAFLAGFAWLGVHLFTGWV